MPVKTLWSPKGSDIVYCLEDGLHISGPVRAKWRELAATGKLTLVEITGDDHPDLRASIEHKAGKTQPTIDVTVPTTTPVTYTGTINLKPK